MILENSRTKNFSGMNEIMRKSPELGLLIGLDDQKDEGVQAPAARHGGQNNPPEVFIVELADLQSLQNLAARDAESETCVDEAAKAVVNAQNHKAGFIWSHVDDVRFGDLN